jgi:hypothetical protein
MPDPISPELFDFLQKQDWERIFPRLVYYADQRMSWMGLPAEGVKGKNAEAIATEAMVKVFEGVRKPKPKDLIDFEYYMGSVINSLISSLKVSKENKTKSDEEVEAISDQELVDQLFDGGFLKELEVKEILDKIEKDLMDDGKDDMYLVFCEMRQGSQTQEIAKSLGNTESEVANIKKQLSRYFKRIKPKRK